MRLKSQAGQALVEFALVLPLLLILLFGIMEFGIILYDKAVITNASREGARYGIVAQTARYDESQIRDIVRQYCTSRLITFGGSGIVDVIAPEADGTASFGEPLTVTVSYSYRFLVLPRFIIGGLTNPVNLNATTLMKYE